MAHQTQVRAQRPDPDLSHQLRLASGRTVVVREGSGTAFAETTGRAGLARARPWLDPVAWEDRPDRRSSTPLVVGLGLAAAIVSVATWRLKARGQTVRRAPLHFRPDSHNGGVHVGNQAGALSSRA